MYEDLSPKAKMYYNGYHKVPKVYTKEQIEKLCDKGIITKAEKNIILDDVNKR